MIDCSRRKILTVGALIAVGGAVAARPAFAKVKKPKELGQERRLHIVSAWSGEAFDGLYFEDGRYERTALRRIRQLFRDPHNGRSTGISVGLVDVLSKIHGELHGNAGLVLTSGYRSPSTNRDLRLEGGGAAAHSYHLRGMAADVYAHNVSVDTLFRMAIDLHSGGVGYYPEEGFVHLDVGPRRRWIG